MKVIRANEENVYPFPGVRGLKFMLYGDYNAIVGHVPYGVHTLSRRNPRYITFLRDPLERCISWYYFVQEWSGHPVYRDATTNSIVEFYQNSKYQNMQAKFIGGHLLLRRLRLPTSYYLSTAMARLRNVYEFGIVESYDASVRLLCQALGWQQQLIVHSRSARLRPKTEELSANDIQQLTRLNQADFKLYAFAKGLFRQRCHQAGIDLDPTN